MYVILVNEDNTLCTTKRERIMQRSKLVDDLWFLAHPNYKGYDMSMCTVHMEYILPVSKTYRNEILVLSEDRYKDHLKYVLPFDTMLTAEAGDIEVQLTFLCVDVDKHGNIIQRARKISPTTITIHPIAAWSDIIPDSVLTPLDQRIIKMDAQIKALNEAAIFINENKADNIDYDKNKKELQLKSGDKLIGNRIAFDESECNCDENGVPVVDFSEKTGEKPDDDNNNEDSSDIVLF